MANQTLRKLARAYADGNLDKESYRKSRAELIQGIVSATIPLAEIEYPPLVLPPEPKSLDDTQQRNKNDVKKPSAQKAQAQAAPQAEPDIAQRSNGVVTANEPGSSNKMLFIGLGLTVIAIIIVAMMALTGGSPKQKTAATTVSTDNSTNTISASPTTKAQELIQEFLKQNNWSSSSLDYFQKQWAQLPAGNLLTSKDSLEMGQLTNAIYKQLLEEQALSGLVDDDSSINKQRQLVYFATELGINDTRISLPEDAQLMNEAMEDMQP